MPARITPPPHAEMVRLAKLGGIARAKVLTKRERSRIGRLAAARRWGFHEVRKRTTEAFLNDLT